MPAHDVSLKINEAQYFLLMKFWSLCPFFSESVYDLVSWTGMSQINKIEGDKERDPIQVSERSIIFSHEEIFLSVYEPIFRTAFLTTRPLETNRTLISVNCLFLETLQS